jgi:hypothetical protein
MKIKEIERDRSHESIENKNISRANSKDSNTASQISSNSNNTMLIVNHYVGNSNNRNNFIQTNIQDRIN